jgi:hypothetical protein
MSLKISPKVSVSVLQKDFLPLGLKIHKGTESYLFEGDYIFSLDEDLFAHKQKRGPSKKDLSRGFTRGSTLFYWADKRKFYFALLAKSSWTAVPLETCSLYLDFGNLRSYFQKVTPDHYHRHFQFWWSLLQTHILNDAQRFYVVSHIGLWDSAYRMLDSPYMDPNLNYDLCQGFRLDARMFWQDKYKANLWFSNLPKGRVFDLEIWESPYLASPFTPHLKNLLKRGNILGKPLTTRITPLLQKTLYQISL